MATIVIDAGHGGADPGAELGFLGVAVLTAVQTPLFCGAETFVLFFFRELKPFCRAGAVDFFSEV